LKSALTILLIAAIWLIQCLVGGTRPIYSFPSYAILGVAALLTVFWVRRPIAPPNSLCLGTTAVFFAYVLWRAASSPVDYLWWMDFYMVLACLVVYLLTALYLRSSQLRMAIVLALLALAFAEFLIGIRQFRVGDSWMPFGFVRSDYGSRASGMFISSIHLAGYLEAVGVIALSVAIWSSWEVWKRIAVGYVAILCYCGVAITGSRGGYLSSVFSLVALAAITLWTRRMVNPGRFARTAIFATVVLAVSVGAAFLVMQQSDLLRNRLNIIVKRDVRIYNWQAALDQFKVAPVFGTGAGTHLYYGRFYRRPQIQADPEHAHSDYLELLAEYGLVGIAGMVVFVFVHLRSGFTAVRAIARTAPGDPFHLFRSHRLALLIGALAALAAYLAHSVTDFNLHIPGNALLFAFLFGVLAGPNVEAGTTSAAPAMVPIFQGVLPALGIWILAGVAPKIPGDYWNERARKAMYYRQYREALEFAQVAARHESRNPYIYYQIAGAYSGLALTERDPDARRELRVHGVEASRQGLVIFPEDEHSWIRLAMLLDDLRRFREAREAYQSAIALDPKLGSLRNYFARHLALVGRVEEAEEQLSKVQELGSGRDSNPGPSETPPDPIISK
jgi:O-antigen ligase